MKNKHPLANKLNSSQDELTKIDLVRKIFNSAKGFLVIILY